VARKLSVAMIVKDEADRIGPTLAAITCADEILVVDGGSKDGTADLCRARGCTVLQRDFDGYGAQKAFAVSRCANDWVLNLDADEVLTPELDREIRALLDRPEIPEAAFQVEMRLVFLGRAFRWGKHARERHVRLFDRTRAGYDDAEVHEGVRTRGPVGRLRERLYHHSFRDQHHFVQKMNDYTTRGASVLRARGKGRPAWLSLLSWPFYFVRSYLLQGNFLNGVPGLVWSFYFSVQPVVKYLKTVEPDRAG
jgi:glycosyltransferase involved in cell wall biosynthesis